ncbi:MAG TPA: SRPBCC domain-containing protein [Acidimicrobiales bacterium]|nr:SRPBCC domain-containing protein [Acidimicrobiales bacterium]
MGMISSAVERLGKPRYVSEQGATVPYNFEVSDQIPATPQEIYDAWMSSEGHSAMTGGAAHVDPVIGGEYDAWDCYIRGTTLTPEPPARLVQTWRSTRFTDANENSQIEVLLEANGAGTLVRVLHRNVPDDHRGYEDGG